ncbi:hypothetical protein ILUMI_03844 [Ignelater luminosus]|uniref:Uncharacterized protein n=1 Tax=Ignelater luminosus TaxID=2038154 RepID=A0A8K0DFK0_IGNLU|nr:hypothetical protein ILUMI_03844 [Ignelater luminosus]
MNSSNKEKTKHKNFDERWCQASRDSKLSRQQCLDIRHGAVLRNFDIYPDHKEVWKCKSKYRPSGINVINVAVVHLRYLLEHATKRIVLVQEEAIMEHIESLEVKEISEELIFSYGFDGSSDVNQETTRLKNIQEHKWKEEDMKQAIEAVRNRTNGYLKGSKVPRAILFRYCKSDDIKKDTLGRHPILPPELEAKLVNHIVKMETQFLGLTKRDLCFLAFQLARQNNIPNKFSLLQESAGKNG